MHCVGKGEDFWFPFYSASPKSSWGGQNCPRGHQWLPLVGSDTSNLLRGFWRSYMPSAFRCCSYTCVSYEDVEMSPWMLDHQKMSSVFLPLVWTVIYYLTRLNFSAFFRRSHVNLPQETGKFKNKNLPRLFNAKTPSVAQEIHKSADAERVFWLDITVCVLWLFYCSLGAC